MYLPSMVYSITIPNLQLVFLGKASSKCSHIILESTVTRAEQNWKVRIKHRKMGQEVLFKYHFLQQISAF